MEDRNYIVFTDSCSGYFTNSKNLELLVAKGTLIEIYQWSNLQFQNEDRDSFFLTTEEYQFVICKWDKLQSKILLRSTLDISESIGRPSDNGQLGVVGPSHNMIGLHLYDGLFKAIRLSKEGLLFDSCNIRLVENEVLDIKFLWGYSKPTIAVLFQDNKMARHVKTYEVAVVERMLNPGPWSQSNLDEAAHLIIPVPMPLCGAVIIGEQSILYCSDTESKAIFNRPLIVRAYTRVSVDDSQVRYLLCDHVGILHLLGITYQKKRCMKLEVLRIGDTSIASTISFVGQGHVYVGSKFCDSQVIWVDFDGDSDGSRVRLVRAYDNLGPIVDFCVTDVDKEGQSQVVTCSGAYKNSSLRVVRYGIAVDKLACVDLPGIKGMWSLGSSNASKCKSYLVISFVNETRILELRCDSAIEELVDTDIEGFDLKSQTLFCHNALHDQLLQVTPSSVRLINIRSKRLVCEWNAPYDVNVATANNTQVLLACGGRHLVYLEVGCGTMVEIQRQSLDYEVSCVSIDPPDAYFEKSMLAAVGLWVDVSVRIYSLPSLELMTTELLGGDMNARSILLCKIEGVMYLFCSLGEGSLFNFVMEEHTGKLSERKKITLGSHPVSLSTFPLKGMTCVFAASDRPSFILSKSKKLLYSDIYMDEVKYTCPFNSSFSSESIAIGTKDKLIIGIVDPIQKLQIQRISLPNDREHAKHIAYQAESGTFAICTSRYCTVADYEMNFVRLLDHKKYNFLSYHLLDKYELGCSISSCSFIGDNVTYYCVGTAYVLPEKKEPRLGRILVFVVEDETLKLCLQKRVTGAVYSLHGFDGKLLVTVNEKVQVYRWDIGDDGLRKLLLECEHDEHVLALRAAIRGNSIVVAEMLNEISAMHYKYEVGGMEEYARRHFPSRTSALAFLDDETVIAANVGCDILSLTNDKLMIVDGYHLGDVVNTFHSGSLVRHRLDSNFGQVNSVIFATVSGVIGVVAQISNQQYSILSKLQEKMAMLNEDGSLSHSKFRSYRSGTKRVESRSFLDGDLLESFLDLSQTVRQEIAESLDFSLDDISSFVHDLVMLH